jgi:hypothetical protein
VDYLSQNSKLKEKTETNIRVAIDWARKTYRERMQSQLLEKVFTEEKFSEVQAKARLEALERFQQEPCTKDAEIAKPFLDLLEKVQRQNILFKNGPLKLL